jgi:hypothetical protein
VASLAALDRSSGSSEVLKVLRSTPMVIVLRIDGPAASSSGEHGPLPVVEALEFLLDEEE